MRQHGDGAYGRQGRRGPREVSGVDFEVREEVVGCGDGDGGQGGREGGGAVLGGGVPLVMGGDREMERGDRQDLQKHVGVVAGDGIGMVRWGGEEECDEG